MTCIYTLYFILGEFRVVTNNFTAKTGSKLGLSDIFVFCPVEIVKPVRSILFVLQPFVSVKVVAHLYKYYSLYLKLLKITKVYYYVGIQNIIIGQVPTYI